MKNKKEVRIDLMDLEKEKLEQDEMLNLQAGDIKTKCDCYNNVNQPENQYDTTKPFGG